MVALVVGGQHAAGGARSSLSNGVQQIG